MSGAMRQAVTIFGPLPKKNSDPVSNVIINQHEIPDRKRLSLMIFKEFLFSVIWLHSAWSQAQSSQMEFIYQVVLQSKTFLDYISKAKNHDQTVL